MARLEYFLVCRSVSTDVDTNEITLSGVIEDVFLVPDEVVIIPKVVAVSSWTLSPGDLETDFQTILVISRPGETTGKPFPMNLSKGRRRYRTIQGVLSIPLDQPGDLKFQVLLNGEPQATHTVTVHPPDVRPREATGSPSS